MECLWLLKRDDLELVKREEQEWQEKIAAIFEAKEESVSRVLFRNRRDKVLKEKTWMNAQPQAI